MVKDDQLESLADMVAFVGNSLLLPVNRTSAIGLDPGFWRACPDFGDAGIKTALHSCSEYLEKACCNGRDVLLRDAAVEYARLFVGPPQPVAPPWETAYRTGGKVVGFGEATIEMRHELQAVGLGFVEGRNQYEDHIGIELLLLSTLAKRAANGECDVQRVFDFAQRPLSWIGPFCEKVALSAPRGYYDHLLAVAEALLEYVALS